MQKGAQSGTVKFFNDTKGYGFIIPDGTNDELFVHASDVEGKINKGEKVTFNMDQGDKGLKAVAVQKSK